MPDPTLDGAFGEHVRKTGTADAPTPASLGSAFFGAVTLGRSRDVA